jgi:hypothetical protein
VVKHRGAVPRIPESETDPCEKKEKCRIPHLLLPIADSTKIYSEHQG